MSVKMRLLPDHIPVSAIEMSVPGGPLKLTFISIDGIEEELDMAELPDRTKRPGGNSKPIEFKAVAPLHHTIEHAYLEEWYAQALGALPGYLRPVVMSYPSVSGLQAKTVTLVNVWPCKKKYPDADMNNEGELGTVEWTFSADLMVPSP